MLPPGAGFRTYFLFRLYSLTFHLMTPLLWELFSHALASVGLRTSRIRHPDKYFLKTVSVRCVTVVRREDDTGDKPEP